MLWLYIIGGIIVIPPLLIILDDIRVLFLCWYKFHFKKKILYPYVVKDFGWFGWTIYIKSVEWFWCNIDKEEKPNYYFRKYLEYWRPITTINMNITEYLDYRNKKSV